MAVGAAAVEAQIRIGLAEVVVAADLDWTVGEVGDGEGDRRAAGIQHQLAGHGGDRTRGAVVGDVGEYSQRRHGQEAAIERQAQVAILGGDRVVHGDQLGAIGEGAFDLDVVNQLGHARHHLATTEEALAEIHQRGDAAAVADELQQLGGDQRDRLGMVEAHAPRQALLRQHAGLVQGQLVDLAWSQVHVLTISDPRDDDQGVASEPARPGRAATW